MSNMVDKNLLKKIILETLFEEGYFKPSLAPNTTVPPVQSPAPIKSLEVESQSLADLGLIDLKTVVKVPHPANLEALQSFRRSTAARVAVYRAGPRYLTDTWLRFRADHALATDAVFTEISQKWLEDNNLPSFKTLCSSKDEFLTRPDLGRQLDIEEQEKIKKIASGFKVVIYIADGLSTTAVAANALDALKAIVAGLSLKNIKVNPPFFVQYGRVGTQDVISEITSCEVIGVLIGERPGLVTSESMSAYLAYRATVNMAEARRTVVSNIHKGGTPAVEAGSYISEIILKMLENKASGLDLKL
ncbi:MAG: ethanolamine ammonia-lyase subunit EutC [Deltaproteobacteria bacterium]|jgi:ethanolamine ammonia-lyase small subunit|nr:ethanolamine ammonia-lyase subunit EutC [Deltaproteobacteria bacterium]